MTRTRKGGFGIEPPSKSCNDINCPFHGTLKMRGKQFTGKVVSDKMQKSAIVEWVGWKYIPKYERYKRTRTKVVAHNPSCLDAKEGDLVRIGECRPLSKTKNFVILKVLGRIDKYELEKMALEEGKHKEKAAVEKATAQPKPGAAEESTTDDEPEDTSKEVKD